MVRFLHRLAIVGLFCALSLIAIGLMVGTMDAVVSASPAVEVNEQPKITSVKAKQSILVTAEAEPSAELVTLTTRVSALETELCLLKLDQPKRTESLLQKIQALRQEMANKKSTEKVATVQTCATCPTCSANAAKAASVKSAPAKVVVQSRPAPVSYPAQTGWRRVDQEPEDYRERRFFGRR